MSDKDVMRINFYASKGYDDRMASIAIEKLGDIYLEFYADKNEEPTRRLYIAENELFYMIKQFMDSEG
jgi:hypothetical protein